MLMPHRGGTDLKPKVVAALIFSLLTAVVAAAFWGEFRHVPERRPEWISTKPHLERGLMGAVAYTATPYALAGHRLNIGAWNGFQEVIYKKKVMPGEVVFDLELPDFSFFSFIYNRTDRGFSGIRLSRSPVTPNICFTADPSGAFLTKVPLKIDMHHQKTFRFKAVFGSDTTDVYMDGKKIVSIKGKLHPDQQLGFRGGPWDVFIDHFKMKDVDGHTYRDSFGALNHFPFECFVAFILLAAPVLVMARVYGRRGPGKPVRFFLYYMACCLVLIVIGASLYGVLRWRLAGDYRYAARYFQVRNDILGDRNPIEKRDDVLERLRRDYEGRYVGQRHRLIFIGTSQTWGSGASKNGLDWVSLVQRKLDEVSKYRRYECINTGISGEEAPALYDLYEKEWIAYEPRTTIINLGNNDQDHALFEETLKRFVKLNQEKGIQTVFVLEANDVNAPAEHIERNHIIMSNMAQELGIPLIDLHGFMGENRDTGFQWWDFVHFTDFGHQLAARIVFDRLTGILKIEPRQ